MGERKDDLGPAVLNGVPRYFSPSSLGAADPQQYGGCLRRWWYKYVGGRKEPFTADQRLGVEVHAQIENYLRTGEKTLGQIALAGFHYVPQFNPHGEYLIEHFIGDGTLTAAGVPVLGYIDLLGPSTEGEDPPNTLEALDWKSTGNIANNAKTASQLLESIQMPTYAEWEFRRQERTRFANIATHARLSHVYFQTKGRPQASKVSILCTREQIARRWESVEVVARRVIDAAKETDPSKIEGHEPSCTAYRGCPHREVCPQGKNKSIADIFGTGGAMSLLEKLNLPTGVTPVPGAPAVQLDLKAELARLKAAEDAAAAPAVPPEFVEACKVIEASGMGFPMLKGEAATVKCAMHGSEFKGAALSGSGRLAPMTLTTVSEVVQLAGEIAGTPVQAPPPPAMPSLLAPEAPASNPAIAALPVEGIGTPPASNTVSGTTPVIDTTAVATVTVTPVATEAPKKKPGRPKKTAPAPAGTTPIATQAPTTTAQATGLEVFADCLPSCEFASLESYVDGLNAAICEQYGLMDLRAAPEGSPLAFGKWRAAVAACVRAAPPPPGTYYLDTRGREVAAEVSEALRPLCDLHVRGVR